MVRCGPLTFHRHGMVLDVMEGNSFTSTGLPGTTIWAINLHTKMILVVYAIMIVCAIVIVRSQNVCPAVSGFLRVCMNCSALSAGRSANTRIDIHHHHALLLHLDINLIGVIPTLSNPPAM